MASPEENTPDALTSRCQSDEAICAWVLEQTDSRVLANLADFIIGKPLTITVIIVATMLVRWVLHRLVDRVVRSAETPLIMTDKVTSRVLSTGLVGRGTESVELDSSTRRAQRARTVGSLVKSVISGTLVAIAATMILSELGFNIAPIVASAGIAGVALGFGAQTLVKDFLSGMFMIFEDQYGVGDVIRINDIQGTVEAVTLRVTRLRDRNGTVWYLRNGEIVRVGNMSQNWARAVLDIQVSHQADVLRTRHVLLDIANELWQDEEWAGRVIEAPEVPGVESISAEGVIIRVSIKTAPMEQWAVARALRERIKTRFEAEGIVVPHTRYVTDAVEPDSPTASD